MRKRSWCFFTIMVALFAGLLGRILYIMKAQPAQVASANSAWTISVATTRGTIYDHALRPLVNEHKQYRAALMPDESTLSLLYPVTDAQTFSFVRDCLSSGSPTSIALTGPVAFSEGLELFHVPIRYGDRVLAPHVIGYLDNSLQKGVSGIEMACDEQLKAYGGTASATFYTDGNGTRLAGISPTLVNTTANSTGGVVLTIDRDVQKIVEDLAPLYLTKGAVVVMDPFSGDIKAIASFPSFQPDTVAESIENNDGALINRALALYDCGSVFKIITTAAALESGIPASQLYTCAGSCDVRDVRFHCHNRLGHQTLDMTGAFSESCNVYYIRLAQQMGAKALRDMAQRFGFNGSIRLAEGISTASPLIPDEDTVTSSPGALANLSFGQGYLMTSPLHISQITSTIVNDGTMPTVRLIDGYLDENGVFSSISRESGSTILSSSTATQLRAMMEQVVATGTGKGAAPKVCTAAGKTGTAETGQSGGNEAVVQSWFTGYFPADDPQYVVTVLAEDANNTNGRSSALFCEISNKLYNLIGE